MDRGIKMKFMCIFEWEPGKTEEVLKIRTTEKIPPGMKTINEWMALDGNMVFRLIDVEDPAALLASNWGDVGYVALHPVMEAAEAMKYLR